MIKSFHFSSDGTCQYNLNSDELIQARSDSSGLLWINLEYPSPEEIQDILVNLFHFHPLVIEDCLSIGYQSPKIDEFDDYIFIIAHVIKANQSMDDITTQELDFFLGSNYLVTFFLDEGPSPVESVWLRLSRDERLYKHGADLLCHTIMDDIVDNYTPVIDEIEEAMDSLENEVLEKPNPKTLEQLIQIKHGLLAIRRIILPQREVMNRLSRDDFPQIKPQVQIYYRDIYDHLVRIQDMIESLRDIVAGDLDIYLNSTSLRLNEIMKALTIVSTIFLPLSFIAGVYGMNFHFMPEISKPWGYPMAWLIFLLIAAGMLYFFKKRRWF